MPYLTGIKIIGEMNLILYVCKIFEKWMLFYFITSADEVEGGYVYGPVCLPVCLRARVCVCVCL